jgi:hypothetical protein
MSVGEPMGDAAQAKGLSVYPKPDVERPGPAKGVGAVFRARSGASWFLDAPLSGFVVY